MTAETGSPQHTQVDKAAGESLDNVEKVLKFKLEGLVEGQTVKIGPDGEYISLGLVSNEEVLLGEKVKKYKIMSRTATAPNRPYVWIKFHKNPKFEDEGTITTIKAVRKPLSQADNSRNNKIEFCFGMPPTIYQYDEFTRVYISSRYKQDKNYSTNTDPEEIVIKLVHSRQWNLGVPVENTPGTEDMDYYEQEFTLHAVEI